MLIGLTGQKGVGKDTAASYLIEQHGFIRVAFADPLKDSVAALLGITREKIEQLKNDPHAVIISGIQVEGGWVVGGAPMTFRNFLQRYGTEAHREVFGDDFWVQQGFDRIRDLIADGQRVVVTDVRFEDEARVIRELGGDVVAVRRPSVEAEPEHASEEIPEAGVLIWNDGDLDNLYAEVLDVLGILGFISSLT